MQDLVNKYLKKFKRERRMRRRLGSVLVALALVVSLGVYWQLKLTGAALTNETFCGLEEHQHDEDCYEWVLVCGYDDVTETTVTLEELEALWKAGESETAASAAVLETTAAASETDAEVISGHTHTAECYQTVTTLVCGLTEFEGHTHSESCYSTVLTCGLAESEGHAHSESCYDEEGNLTCGLEESEGHTHDESCYTTELTCGQAESTGHTHDASCYVTEEVLICGLDETEGVSENAGTADVTAADGESDIAVISDTNETDHVHTAACYEKVAVCGLEEHTHTAACLSDVTADVETAADWEATIPANLSDDWAEAVVAIAQSQLGYSESTLNYVLDEDGETLRGYTRYGAWAGNEYGAWDAMFASFCLNYAGISTTDFPESTGAYAWAVKLQNLGLYAAAGEYTPAAGDLVFSDSDADGKIDRVGIVITVDEENDSLTVIEGDYAAEDGADAVCEVAYGLSDEAVVGYGVLPEKDSYAYTLTCEGVDYTVVVSYGDDAELPEGVELIVTEYAKDSETYLARYAEAAALYGWNEEEDYTDSIRLFNIGFYVNGEEVEPAAAVKVSITYQEQESESESFTVTHFGEDGTETIETKTGYSDGEQTITFGMESFSDVMVVADDGTATVADSDYTMEVGQQITLTVNSNTGNWSSSYTSVATVSGYGRSATVTAVGPGTTTISKGGSRWTITVSNTVRVYVYVAAYEVEYVNGEEVKTLYSDEMLELLGIDPDTLDNNGYFPAGVITLDSSYLTSKGNNALVTDTALINSEDDWDALLEALSELDTYSFNDDYSANTGNSVGDYIENAAHDIDQKWGSMKSALFHWHYDSSGTQQSYGFDDQTVMYHLDLRFETVKITYIYGENNLDTDGETAGTKVFIKGATMDYTPTIKVPNGYKVVGYYNESDFQTEWNAVDQPINEDTMVYIKIVPQENVVINYVVQEGEGTVTSPGDNGAALQKGYESFNPATGSVIGSTATAAEGYVFDGWYLDEACTQPVDSDWVDENGKITPQAPEGGWKEDTTFTYYAKFVPAKYTITISKVDADTTAALSGAVFHIYQATTSTDDEGNETTTYSYYFESDGTVTWGIEGNATDITTDNGTVTVSLSAGTYYLQEVTAPDGYNLLDHVIEFTVNSDGSISCSDGSASGSNLTLTVTNTAGTVLPNTGGPGTGLITLLGLLLCGGAGLLLYRRKMI